MRQYSALQAPSETRKGQKINFFQAEYPTQLCDEMLQAMLPRRQQFLGNNNRILHIQPRNAENANTLHRIIIMIVCPRVVGYLTIGKIGQNIIPQKEPSNSISYKARRQV